MAKKSVLSLLPALTILGAILFLAAMNGYAQSSEKAECEWEKINNQLTEKIKNSTKENFVFYLTELASVNFASDADDNLKGLLNFLEEIESEREKLTHEDKKHVLYLKAECNYKLKKYNPARKQYLQLKLILDDKEDPLFLEVQTRLKQTSKKAKRARFKDKSINLQQYLPYFLISLLILILFSFIFNRWHRWFLKRSKKDTSYSFASEIVPGKKLIKLEQMCRQDGRASEQDVKEYKEGDHAGRDNKSGTYACLIVEGHEMIERVNKCAPYPIALISKIPLRRWLSPFWIYTLLGFVFVILWGSSSYSLDGMIFEEGHNMGIIKLGFLAALVISSLTGIRIMSQKTIGSLDELVSMMEGRSPGPKTGKKKDHRPQSIRGLEEWIKSLFRSPWQFFAVLPILAIISLRMHIAGKSFTSAAFVIDYFFIFLLVLLVCPVIWLLGRSLLVLDKICTMEDLSINPLSPLKTMGLQKWTSVIGTYAITGSIVLTFGISIPVVCDFICGKLEFSSWFWFILIFPLLIVYWVYPYQKLASLVKSLKVKRMHFFKTKISQIFNEWVFEEELLKKLGQKNIAESRAEMFERLKPQLHHMDTYYNAFKRIDQSPESFFDLNSVVELAKAIGLPSLFALLLTLLSQLY